MRLVRPARVSSYTSTAKSSPPAAPRTNEMYAVRRRVMNATNWVSISRSCSSGGR